MNNKHVVLALLACLAMAGVWMMVRKQNAVKKAGHICTIGILQAATHPALDAAREGFVDALKERVGDKIECVVRNGQGTISTIHALAQQFHARDDIDGVYAIATPAAQAIISVENAKPICLAAVSVTADLKELFSEPHVCGVSDMINVHAEIDGMMALLPHIQTVGIVYSTAEINSIAMSEAMVQDLEKRGMNVVLIGVASEAELEPALLSALRKVDVVLAPTDNMVANAISLIVAISDQAEKPVIVSDNMLVKYGALMARGVDYYACGRQAGEQMLAIFVDGKTPESLSIVAADNKDIFVNKEVAERFGVVVPKSIEKDVVLV